MASLVDIYLSRLVTRLGKRLPQHVTQEYVLEIGTHLRESISDLVSQGKSEDDASIEAIKSIGSDRLIAESIIRSRSRIDEKSVWRLAWISMLIVVLYLFIPETFENMRVIPQWLMDFTSSLPKLFFLVFGYACWRSRRILIMPMAIAAGLLIPIALVQILGFGPLGFTEHSRQMRERDVQGFVSHLTELRHYSKTARTIAQTRSYPSFLMQQQSFLAPKSERVAEATPWYATPSLVEDGKGHMIRLEPVPTETMARDLWNRNGLEYTKCLEAGIQEDQSSIAFWRSKHLDSRAIAEITSRLALAVIELVGVMLTFNLLVLGTERLKRLVIARAWSPERTL